MSEPPPQGFQTVIALRDIPDAIPPIDLTQRALDVWDAFPSLVLAILFVAMLGASSRNVTLAAAIVMIPNTNRVARAVALGLRSQAFVEAAVATGASHWRVRWHLRRATCSSTSRSPVSTFL